MATEPQPLSVIDARDGLSRTLKRFRADDTTEPVVLGSHRKPEAVLLPYREYRRLRAARNSVGSLLEVLQHRRSLIRRLAELNRIGVVSVFGSVARGEETPDSDVDLLVSPLEGASYFDLAQFAEDMELLIGRHVDVVSRRAIDEKADRRILTEAIQL